MRFPVKRYKVIVENQPFPNMRDLHWSARRSGYTLEKVYPKRNGWFLKRPGHPAIGPFTLDQVKDYLEQGKPASTNVSTSFSKLNTK